MLLAVYTIHLLLYENKSGCSWSSTHDSAKGIGLIPRGYTNLLKGCFFFGQKISFDFGNFSACHVLSILSFLVRLKC